MSSHILQGVFIRGVSDDPKYKLKYTVSQSIQIVNGKIIKKYTYSKIITPANNKYSYN